MDWQKLLADCVDFTQRLIQTPSMPYEEAALAELVMAEMRRLRFEEVWGDGIGNVNGRIHGQNRSLPALVLNSHLDHVDPGDPALWSSLPFAGEIMANRIVGRGACDIKGPLAVQVYSMAAFLKMGERPLRDVVFSGVVQEEIGGAGAKYWVENLDYPVALVVLGEPSDNDLALGHRGVVQMWLRFNGRSVHASVPEKGKNPNFALADFLERLKAVQSKLSSHPHLGPTTVSPTIIEVDTQSPNVTPAWTRVLLDFRTASESTDNLQAFVHQLAGDWSYSIHNAWTNEPFPASDEIVYGYYTSPESEIVRRVRTAVAQGMGYMPALTRYQFATDGRYFVPYGIPVIGLSPAEEDQAHIADESISIAKMADGLRGYVQLLRDF